VFKTDFEGIGLFISDWEPLGWSRGDYATGHGDDLWCRANIDYMGNLSRAVGYTITAHSFNSTLYGAKLGYNSHNGVKNVDNGYPDPGMDSWVRYAPPNAASYDGMTLTFWYWAKTESPSYEGALNDYLCVNINNGVSTTRAWMQPSPDSQGWRMATVDLPAGTIWMEWEFKSSENSAGYPGALIDDMTVTSGKVVAAPPASHVGGVSSYSSSRTVQVPVSVSDADRVSLYYRTGGSGWTMYTNPTAPDGLFTYFTITFQAPADGRYEVYSIAGNATYTEPLKSAAEASFTVDTVAPSVTITSPDGGSIFGTGTATIGWTSSDAGSGVAFTAASVDGGSWTNGTGSYTFRSLSDGTHTATVLVQDRAGNFARSSVTFVVNLDAPTMTVSPVGTNVPRSAPVVVTFQDPVDHGAVSITVGGVAGNLSWTGDKATFTPSSVLASNTTYQVTVTGRDDDGDAFSDSWSFTTVEDRGSVSGVVLNGDGNPVAGATVTLSNGMKATTNDHGEFSFTGVPAGHYTLNVSKNGYQVMTSEVDVSSDQINQVGSLSLRSGTDTPVQYIGAAIIVVIAGLGAVFVVLRKK
jgi:hypothetical protein